MMMKNLVCLALFIKLSMCQPGIEFTLTAAQWAVILDKHNDARNSVASGSQTGLGGVVQPAAANMNSLIWDAGLAASAQATADNCDEDHSAVSTSTLDASLTRFAIPATPISLGENLAFITGTPTFAKTESLTDAWINERDFYLFGQTPPGTDPETCTATDSGCGHYTQIVWADTRYVGCGLSDCTADPPNIGGTDFPTLLVCQFYRPGNFQGQDPYEEGTACSNCPSDRDNTCPAGDANFEALCHGGLDSTADEASPTGTVDICDNGVGTTISTACGAGTSAPSGSPSASPSATPSSSPSGSPSGSPSSSPSGTPSSSPSATPSSAPSATPSASPTSPTQSPVFMPSESPSIAPSTSPTASTAAPSASPSASPSATPSATPSASPSASPSSSPTASTAAPSKAPSGSPSSTPSKAPSSTPSKAPSGSPSSTPSKAPSSTPSGSPSNAPAVALVNPTGAPTGQPTPVTAHPLYNSLVALFGETGAIALLASDLTDAQLVAFAALAASGATDAELLAYLRSTGIPEAQVLVIAVALDLDLNASGSGSVSADSGDGTSS